MTIAASRFLLLSAAALGLSSVIQAQAPALRNGATPGVVEVTGAQTSVNPEREKVERADAALKALQEEQITDPTVFVKSAALGELTQMELAKLARSKSQDANIRSFAARMLDDHDAIHIELTTIAKRKDFDVPVSLVYQDEQMVEQAAEITGAQFDAWYARQMITEYEKASALFRAAANMEDAELSAFAKKTLPALDEHQKLAMVLAGAAGQ